MSTRVHSEKSSWRLLLLEVKPPRREVCEGFDFTSAREEIKRSSGERVESDLASLEAPNGDVGTRGGTNFGKQIPVPLVLDLAISLLVACASSFLGLSRSTL